MSLFGAHMSIAGGYHNAVLAARQLGCQALQLFVSQPKAWPVIPADSARKTAFRSGKLLTKNTNQWAAKALSDDNVRQFRKALRGSGIRVTTAHDSYLINLASTAADLYRRSLEAFVVEMQRAELLGLHYLVMHPGSPGDGDVEAGLKRVAGALDEVHVRCLNFRVKVLLETTAGQGNCLGRKFEELARILELVHEPNRVGVCMDTCHVFAAGYALAPEKEYQATMRAFDQTVGLRRLHVFHVNDSLKPLGSRVDRHAHIGRGQLGMEPFRLLVNDARFCRKAMILETPKEDAEEGEMDLVNLAVLRGLVKSR
jgi:deoxyribonuclease-4